jgi:outer membrane protein
MYDPLANYRRVANNWNDWSGERIRTPTATRTVTPQEMPTNPTVAPGLLPGNPGTEPVITPMVTQPPQ